jgi:hypothetical protein
VLITLILHSIILVAIPAGHGYGIMIVLEFISISSIIKSKNEIMRTSFLESSVLLFTLIFIMEKLILIALLFSKNILISRRLLYFGLILMVAAFLLICSKTWIYGSFLLIMVLSSGMPFLMYFGRVLYMTKKNKN